MMYRFYISSNTFWLLMTLTVLFSYFASAGFFTLWLLILGSSLYLLRRKKLKYKDQFTFQSSTYLAPVNGFIYDIQKDFEYQEKQYHLIRFIIPFFNEWGIYLPHDGEIQNVERSYGKRFYRFGNNELKINKNFYDHLNIESCSRTGHTAILKVMRCMFGGKAKAWIVSGDRGRAGSCLGYVPFGASVILLIPATCDIFLKKYDLVIAGETVVAGNK